MVLGTLYRISPVSRPTKRISSECHKPTEEDFLCHTAAPIENATKLKKGSDAYDLRASWPFKVHESSFAAHLLCIRIGSSDHSLCIENCCESLI